MAGRPQAGDIRPGRGSAMSRKTTAIDNTRQARATRIPGCPPGRPGALRTAAGQDTDGHRRPGDPGHPGRTRPRVLGSRRGARDLTLTSGSASSRSVVHGCHGYRGARGRLGCGRVRPLASGNRPGSGQDRRAISPKLLDLGYATRAITCRNVVRGKTTLWPHNLGRSGERAVRRRSLVIKELSRSTPERQNARIWAAPITAPGVRAGLSCLTRSGPRAAR